MKRTLAVIVSAAMIVSTSAASAGQVYGNYGSGYQDPDAPYQGGGNPSGTPYGTYQPAPTYQRGQGGYTGCQPDRDQQVVGTLLGAVVGGLIGNQFGSGRGRTAATVFGAVLGGIAGHEITRSNWCSDRRADAYYYNTAYYDAFDTPNYGEQYYWRNDYSGNYGYVQPVGYTQWGQYQDCRNFQQTIYIQGSPQTATGVACRNANGTWRIVS